MLPKLAEMERNWIIFTLYGVIKNLKGQPCDIRESHVKLTEKNKVGKTTWAKLRGLIGQNFPTRKVSLSVSGEQASKHLASSSSFFLSEIFRYVPAFQAVIFVKYPLLFILSKCLMDSYQVLLIFTEIWPYDFHVSR